MTTAKQIVNEDQSNLYKIAYCRENCESVMQTEGATHYKFHDKSIVEAKVVDGLYELSAY